LGTSPHHFSRSRNMGQSADSFFQGISLLILTYGVQGFKDNKSCVSRNRL